MLGIDRTRKPFPPFGSGMPSIFVASRATTSSPFGKPIQLAGLGGFVEATALSPDGEGLYFHKLVNNLSVIFRASRQ